MISPYLTYLITNLVTALSNLYCDDLPHFKARLHKKIITKTLSFFNSSKNKDRLLIFNYPTSSHVDQFILKKINSLAMSLNYSDVILFIARDFKLLCSTISWTQLLLFLARERLLLQYKCWCYIKTARLPFKRLAQTFELVVIARVHMLKRLVDS